MSFMSALLLSISLLAAPEDPAGKPSLPFGSTDFKQYYATSKQIVEGRNPYDRDEVWRIQKPLGADEVQVPYGPPTSLLPFIPLGWLDFETAVQVFFALNVGMLAICCFLWGKMLFPQSELMPLLAIVTLLAWVPMMSLFWLGQVTAFTLLGFTLWIFLMRQGRPFAAGVALALSIIKPHLAAGPILYAGLVGLRDRQWRMLAALVGAVLLLVAMCWAIRPTIWAEYLAWLPNSEATKWNNATLGGRSRQLMAEYLPGASSYWPRAIDLIVALAAAAWIAALAWKHPLRPANALLVLALWITGTPYAFSYDYALLTPCFILALGHAVFRTKPQWLIVSLGWIVLDISYFVIKSGGKAQGWWESHFFFIPWGALALTLLLLPHDPELNGQDTNKAA